MKTPPPDVWPRVSPWQAGPAAVLDEIRRLYHARAAAPVDQRPAFEPQIRALAEAYKRTADGQATTKRGMNLFPSHRTSP